MRNYELMLALNPQLEEEEVDSLINKYKKLIQDKEGKVTKVNKWGKRELAYEIKDFTEAYYLVLNFSSEEKDISELERVMRLDEKVIRHLLTLPPKTISRAPKAKSSVKEAKSKAKEEKEKEQTKEGID